MVSFAVKSPPIGARRLTLLEGTVDALYRGSGRIVVLKDAVKAEEAPPDDVDKRSIFDGRPIASLRRSSIPRWRNSASASASRCSISGTASSG